MWKWIEICLYYKIIKRFLGIQSVKFIFTLKICNLMCILLKMCICYKYLNFIFKRRVNLKNSECQANAETTNGFEAGLNFKTVSKQTCFTRPLTGQNQLKIFVSKIIQFYKKFHECIIDYELSSKCKKILEYTTLNINRRIQL